MQYNDLGASVRAAIEKGRPLPDWYLNKPFTDFQGNWYLNAFYELSTNRSLGMSIGPIPWTAITEYATYHGLSRLTTDIFHIIIRALDNAYCKKVSEDNKKAGA
jgi:hypothetical protein